MTRAILVTGASGQLGTELQRLAWPAGFEPVALGREALDLRDPMAVAETIASRNWACVVNAPAYTAVDQAESEVIEAWQVNALAPAAMAASCRDAAIPLIHLSTDYVFSGEDPGPRAADDETTPLGVYGASKLGGELAVRSAGVRHAIVRTAWVVSAHGRNFIKTMLALAGSRDRVGVVADQMGSPTAAADLAAAVAAAALRYMTDMSLPSGTFHFANAGAATWADLAEEVFRLSGQRGGPCAEVDRIATADYPTPARRPANSLLDCTSFSQTFEIAPRPWQVAVGNIIDELMGA